MPNLVVIGGPNGAGKSTLAPILLHGLLGMEAFVNVDTIARGLSGFNPDSVAIQAGRIMLDRLHELARTGADCAFETTLASRSFVPWIATQVAAGYIFHLVYIWMAAPELCVARVAQRAREGGHAVPEEVVRRRYTAGWRNFFRFYQPLAASWEVYDNSDYTHARLIAAGESHQALVVFDRVVWARIVEGGRDGDTRET